MSLLKVKELEKADQRLKYSVFGYVRSMQDQITMIIPQIIPYLVLSFYLNDDWFKNGSKGIKIIENNKTVVIGDSGYNFVYGKRWIEYGFKSKWEFKIVSMGESIEYKSGNVIISCSFLLRNKYKKTLVLYDASPSFDWKENDKFEVYLDTTKGEFIIRKIGEINQSLQMFIDKYFNIHTRSEWQCKICIQTVHAKPTMSIKMTNFN